MDLKNLSDMEKHYLASSFKSLKNYSLLSIIASVFLGFSVMWIMMRSIRRMFGAIVIPLGLFPLIILLFMALIGCILLFIAVYLYLFDSVRNLSNYNVNYSSVSSIVKIGYLGGVISLIAGFLTLPLIILSYLLIPIGLLLLIVGKIGLVIILFKLSGDFSEALFMGSAIIYLIGIFILPIDFVAAILLYSASNGMLNKIKLYASLPSAQVV